MSINQTTNQDEQNQQEQTNFFEPIGDTAERLGQAGTAQDQQDREAKDDDDQGEEEVCMPEGVDSIESLCMNCGKNGSTRMLLTSIPFFREVIVVSFRCPHCHHSNNSIQSAGQIQPRGAIYTIKNVHQPVDLNRQVIKSEHGQIKIKELELEIPKGNGKMTTIEGLIRDTIDDLSLNQPARKHLDPLVYQKIEELLEKLTAILQFRSQPVTVELEDITGNSFIEAIDGLDDPNWSKREFNRTTEQNAELGLVPQPGESAQGLTDDYEGEDPEEVYSFPSTCGSCGHTLNTRMKKIEIPHFKEIILMSTNCGTCGYKDNEVKSATAISPRGTKLVLKVSDKEDLARDILKSETAELSIPEIDLHLNPGTLGGRFTTLEASSIKSSMNSIRRSSLEATPLPHPLLSKTLPLKMGQAEDKQNHSKSSMELFLNKFKRIISAETPFTVILDDPISNSFIQNIYAPDDDPAIEKIEYERSFDQNEELGLNDMKTENYS
ncbi:uncharacterized protein PGTG_16110 [Puccinia graminis f. sp. tritici CRL 75-36-700-3]|uniref:Zinc finger ZPR1-type domain-containing protein n=1 Tax=Puccinia graminis f. sp. tritici (strain CRL 75-36-700-3 / race SCCL) TaxID=418459 RepID=E3L1C5_PUCGT|nr:uncharacterized protein PGTG_16110 [Puccinia graminis f. sp. tritici CRL 75-36-700-3]EFP90350.1 hypothetical protein PGTG_16110 [Puccinia graminis f. sp. tritici CRL 75-36-700-3]